MRRSSHLTIVAPGATAPICEKGTELMNATAPTTRASGADLAKLYALVLGVVLTLVGILGFIPALAPDGNLLGIFAINPVHNFVHLISGLTGLGVALTIGGLYSRLYAGVFGVVYGLVTIIGFVQGYTVLDLITVNLADNILHLVITVSALAVFFLSTSVAVNRARQRSLAS